MPKFPIEVIRWTCIFKKKSTGKLILNKNYIVTNCFGNHHTKFEIDETILTVLNLRLEITVTDYPPLIVKDFRF